MTGAPLPPHERDWRHPSELGRAVHEPPSGRSHAIMVSTAAVGLLLVALLAVAVTPGGSPGQVGAPGAPSDEGSASALPSVPGTPLASPAPPRSLVSAVTVRVTTTLGTTTVSVTIAPPATVPPTTETASRVTSTTAAPITLASTTLAPTTLAPTTAAPTTEPAVSEDSASVATLAPIETDGVVVPVGDGVALMTQPDTAPVAAGATVMAELPSGNTVLAVVIAADPAGLVVVSVPADAGESYEMMPAQGAEPTPEDTVHVHGPEVAVVTFGALADLDVADGTPITDTDGNLLGLCVEDPASGVTTMMVIDRARVDAIAGSG